MSRACRSECRRGTVAPRKHGLPCDAEAGVPDDGTERHDQDRAFDDFPSHSLTIAVRDGHARFVNQWHSSTVELRGADAYYPCDAVRLTCLLSTVGFNAAIHELGECQHRRYRDLGPEGPDCHSGGVSTALKTDGHTGGGYRIQLFDHGRASHAADRPV